MKRNWDAELRLITALSDPHEEPAARAFLDQLVELSRLGHVERVVSTEPFQRALDLAPSADVNIFGLSPELSFKFARQMVETTGSTCLFVRDSGRESALA